MSAAAVVAAVPDPELPFVTLADLGIVRVVEERDDGVHVVLTPTYTGCPATEVIRQAVEDALAEAGYRQVEVRTVLRPAWSTDDITEEGRRKLHAAGIAPPARVGEDAITAVEAPVPCPRCGSLRTRRVAAYGATPCKAPLVCQACREPFEHVKPL